MKIPEPEMLPSGRFRIQVMLEGKRMSRTFETREDAIYWASGIKTKSTQPETPVRKMTVGQAIDAYIESKSAVLSPSTILGYKKIRKNVLQDIMDVKLEDVGGIVIQRAINNMAKDHSPKYVRNANGLLTAALGVYKPTLSLHTTLPQKIKHDISIPTTDEINKLHEFFKGKRYELPFLLGAWMGLRTSEIRGLTWDSVEPNKILHIKQALVDGEDGAELKTTKTYSSDRKLKMPDRIADLIANAPRKTEYIVPYNRNQLYKALERGCNSLGLHHYRFHDLRHYYASLMLSVGMPDKYAMEQMGHSSNNMLKNVYQHTMDAKKQELVDALNKSFQ